MATKNTSSAGFWTVMLGGGFLIVLLLAFSWFITPRHMFNRPLTGLFGVRNMMTVSSNPAAGSGYAVGAPMMDSYYSKEAANEMMFYAPSPIPPAYGGDTAATAEPKIIKTGSLTLEVESSRTSASKVSELATAQGGFVQSSNIVENTDGTISAYITIRVPEAKFEATLGALRGMALRVASESVNGQDVTEQYTDLEARLKNAKAQEAQYLDILKKASSVQDILAVQQYLSQVRYEIESYEGQIKSLSNQTTYSTVSVTLTEQANLNIPAGKFDLLRDMKQAGQAVILLFQALLTFVVWFVILGVAAAVPVGIIAGIFWVVIKKIVNR